MIGARYVSHHGSDLLVANAARASFGAEYDSFRSEADGPRTPRGRSDEALILDLARDGHLLPFRHPHITLACTAPLPVARQLGKHQVGMCLAGDAEITFVRLANGVSNGVRKVTIRDLFETWTGQGSPYHRGESGRHQVRRRNIRVLNVDTGIFETGHVVDVTCSGEKPVYRVTLEDGGTLKMSKDHRIYTDAGWQTLERAIGLEHAESGRAVMTRSCRVAKNGVQAAGADTYRDPVWMAARKAEGLSVQGIADEAACGYHNVRKWLRVHGLQFDHLANLTSVNGEPPWNRGKTGYRTSRVVTDAQKAAIRDARSGERSNWWRGGVTPRRVEVNRWLGQVAPRVHASFDYTCQSCGRRGGKLIAHHAIPVAVDFERAFEEANLATVCLTCHRAIHRSEASEAAFAELLSSRGAVVADFTPRRRRRDGNPLRVHFVNVRSVEYVGVETTYDIAVDHPSHNFVANGLVVHNSWSEISRRYKVGGITFHRLDGCWRADVADRRQGSGPNLDGPTQGLLAHIQARNIAGCLNDYEEALDVGASPEQARFLLPQSMDAVWTWTGSLLGWAHLFRQRTHGDVQAETRDFAFEVAKVIDPLFPVAWRALTEAAR